MVLHDVLDKLRRQPLIGYGPTWKPASEPICYVTMLLSAAGEDAPAAEGGEWLLRCQAKDGSVGVRSEEPEPRWPTGLAVLTWLTLQENARHRRYADSIERGLRWILNAKGKTQPRNPQTGHDPTLAAWPWAEGTHSWVEPTAMQVMALRRAGRFDSERCQTGIAVLQDRQLESGGLNYGNTTVLGQELRPHVVPTALALLALAGEPFRPRTARSLDYLEATLAAQPAVMSRCLGLLALNAHGRNAPDIQAWLSSAFAATVARDGSSFKLALIGHAALGDSSPLVMR